MEKSEIIRAIEESVNSTKSKNYSIWTIGITNDPERRKNEHEANGHNTKFWKYWKAESETDAREIEKHFQGKGMKGGGGGGENPTYVYIF